MGKKIDKEKLDELTQLKEGDEIEIIYPTKRKKCIVKAWQVLEGKLVVQEKNNINLIFVNIDDYTRIQRAHR